MSSGATYAATESTNKSWFRQISKRFQRSLRQFFYRLGYAVAGHPKKTIFASIFTVVLFCIGFISFYKESRVEKLWIPQNTLALEHKEWVNARFVSGIRPERIIITSSNPDTSDVANQASLLELITLLRVSYGTTVMLEGQTVTFSDVCVTVTDGFNTYCSVSSVLDLFYNQSLSSTDDFLDIVETTITSLSDPEIKTIIGNSATYRKWNGPALKPQDILAGLSGSGAETTVQAYHVLIMLQNNEIVENGESFDLTAMTWERQWITNLNGVTIPGVTGLRWYVNALVSFKDGMKESMTGDIGKFMTGYVLLTIYVQLTMGELNRVRSRVWLAGMALLSVGFAVGATIGLCSAMGMFYGPVHQILPLLLLGIGIDDAFVITTAYDGIDPALPLRQRMALALAEAGSAITVTSFTNSCAFFIGASTALPALRYFAIWAAIGILFDYALQTTFFVACFTLDGERQEKNKMDVLSCVTVSNPSELNVFGLKQGVLSRFFRQKFSPVILNSYVRMGTLIGCIAMFGVCLYGATELRQDFQPQYFYTEGTYSKEFDNIDNTYFPKSLLPVNIYTGAIDYTAVEIQQNMNTLFQTALNSDPSVVNGTVDSWYLGLRQYASLTGLTSTLPPASYYSTLEAFLSTKEGSRFRRDLIFEKGLLTATRSMVLLNRLHSNDEEVHAMQSLRKTVDSTSVPSAFPYSYGFIFYEQYAVIKHETIQIVVSSLMVVFAVTVVLIGNIYVAFVTLLGVSLSIIDILGIMYFAKIDLNSISVVNLSIAIGLTIDYSAHIGLAFMESVGNRAERATRALETLGPSLVNGGISTLLAISVLLVAKSYIFTIFFHMFVLIIGLGAFHGMIFVPQLLSLLGPASYHASLEEKELEIEQISAKVLHENETKNI